MVQPRSYVLLPRADCYAWMRPFPPTPAFMRELQDAAQRCLPVSFIVVAGGEPIIYCDNLNRVLDPCSELAFKDETGPGVARPQRIEPMARISFDHKMARSETFKAQQVEAWTFNENNDCTVKALAILTGKPYAEVHAAMKAEGRKDRCGAPLDMMQRAAKRLGFNMVRLQTSFVYAGNGMQTKNWQTEIIARYPGNHKTLKSVTTHHPVRFAAAWANVQPMIMGNNDHVAAFKDGRIHDWSVGRALRMQYAYTVTPISCGE